MFPQRLAPWLGLVLMAIAVPAASAAEKLRLLTNIAPPYQQMINGTLDGTSMRALDCALKRIDQPYEVALSPWLRAREQVRQGTVDGFFSVAPEPEMPPGSRLSLPLALERWVWVRPAGLAMPDRSNGNLRLAAVLGSNQLKWLEGQGLSADGSARNATQLLRMLTGDRVQALLLDQAELDAALIETGIDPAGLSRTFEKYAPLGVYFSEAFLSTHPGFLARFDAVVGSCAAANMALPAGESERVMALANAVLADILADPGLLPALRRSLAAGEGVEAAEWLARDRLFTQMRNRHHDPQVAALRDHPLSAKLSALMRSSGGMVAELLLFDARGVAVAAAETPSDLWQADEDKYRRTVPLGTGAVFIDAIAFDQSVGLFQVQVSFSIPGDKPDSVAGGITIGLNVEQALRRR